MNKHRGGEGETRGRDIEAKHKRKTKIKDVNGSARQTTEQDKISRQGQCKNKQGQRQQFRKRKQWHEIKRNESAINSAGQRTRVKRSQARYKHNNS